MDAKNRGEFLDLLALVMTVVMTIAIYVAIRHRDDADGLAQPPQSWENWQAPGTPQAPPQQQPQQPQAQPQPQAPPGPAASLDAALVRAKAENKRVLAVYTTTWCHFCGKMKETLQSEEGQAAAARFVLYVGDAEADSANAERLGVKRVPTSVVLDASGAVVDTRPGYMTPSAFAGWLKSL